MEPYITFTQIKDYLFSPMTTYLQNIYREFTDSCWKGEALVAGKQAHESIEDGRYSQRKGVLLGKTAYWSEMNVGGKIDVWLPEEGGLLVERKRLVDRVWDGDRAQLYAQYFALKEEGVPVRRLAVHSLATNRRFFLPVPGRKEKEWLVGIINEMRSRGGGEWLFTRAPDARAERSIYAGLNW